MLRSLRFISILILNAVIALIGAAIVVSPLTRLFKPHSINQIILRTYLLDAGGAFLLGYLIFRVWQPAPAKWVWLVGACCVAYKAFLVIGYGQYALWAAFSGVECRDGLMAAGCQTWLHFTIPALHLAAYSLGVILSGRLGRKGAPWFVSAYLGRFRPINYDTTDTGRATSPKDDKGRDR
jgi:hypothetical protein